MALVIAGDELVTPVGHLIEVIGGKAGNAGPGEPVGRAPDDPLVTHVDKGLADVSIVAVGHAVEGIDGARVTTGPGITIG